MASKENLINYYEKIADRRLKWEKRNRFYHKCLIKYYTFHIPKNSNVIEIGCGTGDLLNSVEPSNGVGIDFSLNMINIAKKRYPHLKFYLDDIEDLSLNEQFDYIIISDLLHTLWDVQKALKNVMKLCHNRTRIIISNYNFIWEPILKLSEFFRLKQKSPNSNWLSHTDIFNLLELENFQPIKNERKVLFPKYIPLLNWIMNRLLVNLPFFNLFGLVNFFIVRRNIIVQSEHSVSIVIRARNEKGNIENAILRTPIFGKSQQFIFVEGNSQDGTYEEMLRVQQKYKEKNIEVIKQSGKGKGNAVREGFEKSTGDILFILDSDLTTPPEDLPKFYNTLVSNKGEFINGCRLVYPMERQAMRFLNLVGNKFFGWFFSYLLGQKLKDTLCGTKVLFKEDYERIKINRKYFGEFDPFGDFDLLFGASKLNLKIVEIIVRYRDRQYGSTQISRFSHGWLLLRMSFFAANKIKFI